MNVLSRPKLRGIIHLVMSPLALVAGLTLVTITSELRGRVTLTIFTLPPSHYLPVALFTIESPGAPLLKQSGAESITPTSRF